MTLPGDDLLEQLQAPDQRALVFSPLGLGGRIEPAAAARFQTASIDAAVLADDVPQGIRDYWDRVRLLHQHGVLEYEFFTAAADLALLVLEGSLRRRFIDYYDGRIPVIGRRGTSKGQAHELTVSTFDEVWASARDWDLAAPGDNVRALPTSLGTLLAWARRSGLLPGRRSRRIDRSLVSLRNWAAHPSDYTLSYPPAVARRLCTIADYINMLWGHDGSPRQTFCTRVARRPHVIGIAPDGSAAVELRPEQVLELEEERRTFEFTVLLAADEEQLIDTSPTPDGGLSVSYRDGLELTRFPSELLFRGSWSELAAEVRRGAFDGFVDSVEWLERAFLIRKHGQELDHPRSPKGVLASETPLEGNWWLVVADGPWDAFVHVRDHPDARLDDESSCTECFVAIDAVFDSWDAIAQYCTLKQQPQPPPKL